MFKYFLMLMVFIIVACNNSDRSNSPIAEGDDLQTMYANTVSKYDKTVTKIPEDISQSFMYVNGYKTGQNTVKDSLFFNLDYFIQGFVDAYKGGDQGLFKESQMDSIMNAFNMMMTARMDSVGKIKQIQQSVEAVKNLSEAESFLEKNKNEQGVVSLPTLLQYKILTEGKGPIPLIDDYILVHVTSTFIDGTVFDDTRKRGEPRLIPNDKMILGWKEAITKMPVGSRWIVYMHPSLAFGEFGADRVPPNKLIVVDVELIKIFEQGEIQDYMDKHPESSPAK
jgi:FKBP-type peptidyl-prolyl cis-trans isomerase FklB